MREEKTLSDKMIFMKSADGELIQCIYYVDVMEFIHNFKDEFSSISGKYTAQEIWHKINKLAGEKLI